jgi:hypothetical protein
MRDSGPGDGFDFRLSRRQHGGRLKNRWVDIYRWISRPRVNWRRDIGGSRVRALPPNRPAG